MYCRNYIRTWNTYIVPEEAPTGNFVFALDRAGDALTFPSTLPHRWRNDARGESRLLWINTPPTF